MEIRYEKPGDISAIRRVNEAAFETKAEAALVDTLRDKNAHVISMAASDGNHVVGHILFSPVTLTAEGSEVTLLGLAPMAVLPEYQKQWTPCFPECSKNLIAEKFHNHEK